MMKKISKHALAVVLITAFVVLALGSAGSSPSSYSSSDSSSGGGSSSSSQSTYLVTIYHIRDGGYQTTHSYNIKASSEQAAMDEGVYRFTREFPNYSITNYTATKLY